MAGSGVAPTYFKMHLQNLAGETYEHHRLSLFQVSGLEIETERTECKGQILECDISCKELLVDSGGLFETVEYRCTNRPGLLRQ
jgi:hypothetical protein